MNLYVVGFYLTVMMGDDDSEPDIGHRVHRVVASSESEAIAKCKQWLIKHHKSGSIRDNVVDCCDDDDIYTIYDDFEAVFRYEVIV